MHVAKLNAIIFTLFLAVLRMAGCAGTSSSASVNAAHIAASGLIDCFPEGLMNDDNTPVYCETSAIVYANNKIVMASDKPIPGEKYSAVMALDYNDNGPVSQSLRYLTNPIFLSAQKYEDFTLTPDKKYVIATTGFDRIDPTSNTLDGYNTLLFWPAGQPHQVKVVAATSNGNVTSSVSIRQKLSNILKSNRHRNGAPYFKIEGLAAIPGLESNKFLSE